MKALIAFYGAAAAIFVASYALAAQPENMVAPGSKEPSEIKHETAVEEFSPLGVAQVSIQVSDLENSRQFYHNVLGFEESSDLPTTDDQAVAFFKINDHQFIELFPDLQPEQRSPIRRVALHTDDIEKLYNTLLLRGATPSPVSKGRDGNLKFSIPNPPGLELASVDFVQYAPGSQHSTAAGKDPGDRRIGTSVNHVGLVAGDLAAAKKFCVETLGFCEGNAKKRQNGTVYAVHLTRPGASGEYFELSARPSHFDRHQGGIKAHICLTAPDAAAAYQEAVHRGAKLEPVQTTRDKQEKFPFLLFDPDHSRLEFMPQKNATK